MSVNFVKWREISVKILSDKVEKLFNMLYNKGIEKIFDGKQVILLRVY